MLYIFLLLHVQTVKFLSPVLLFPELYLAFNQLLPGCAQGLPKVSECFFLQNTAVSIIPQSVFLTLPLVL
jgi:hypothetical protein